MKPKFNLEDLKRENVYRVPETYFDKLPNRIMQRVTTDAPTSAGSLAWFPKPWRLALAGSGFVAVFATVFLLNTDQAELPQADFLAQVPETEIVNYLLASEQLDRTDLTGMNLGNQNLTAEFIIADQTEIQQELEYEPLDDLYL